MMEREGGFLHSGLLRVFAGSEYGVWYPPNSTGAERTFAGSELVKKIDSGEAKSLAL